MKYLTIILIILIVKNVFSQDAESFYNDAMKKVESGDGFLFNFYVEVTFDDENGKTWVTMRTVFESEDDLKKVVEEYGAFEGGKQNIERMKAYLKKMQS